MDRILLYSCDGYAGWQSPFWSGEVQEVWIWQTTNHLRWRGSRTLYHCTVSLTSFSGSPMQEKLETRLKELREEYAAGQKVMAELQNRQSELHQTLLRISGAIQVLEEMLPGADPAIAESPESPPAT